MEIDLSGRLIVKSQTRTYILNIEEELKELLKNNPELLRKIAVKALEGRIQEAQKEVEEAKQAKKEVRTIVEAIEETLKKKKTWSGFPEETRRKYRKALRELLAEIMDWDDLYEYNIKNSVKRLHELMELRDIIEAEDPLYLEVGEVD